MNLILGLDCGGTKTAAALATLTDSPIRRIGFRPLGMGYAGPSNPYSLGYEQTFANMTSAIHEAFHQAQMPVQPVASIAICMAGAGREDETRRVRAWAVAERVAEQIYVGEDIALVRWAARWEIDPSDSTPNSARSQASESIVTLIAGTGSIACCTDPTGHTERVGGWGYLLGDEGSGFFIGLQGLKSVFAASDRNLPFTKMHGELIAAMRCRTIEELVPAVYRTPLPRSEIAALSRIVLRHATNDPYAREIAVQAVKALSLLVVLALDRAGVRNHPYLLAVSGGLLDPDSQLLCGLKDSLAAHGIEPTRIHVVRHPVHGALYLAASQLVNSET
jgi:N-acetylglucosamine kinase-like BadF-type ATPase